MHVKVVDDNSDEEIEGEERTEDDEEHEIKIHEDSTFVLRLLSRLMWATMCNKCKGNKRLPRNLNTLPYKV